MYIPINVKDGCSYWNSPTPIYYRVEITKGKEWSSLFDEVNSKSRTVIDSLYSSDGWSGFYLESMDQEPSEPQQGILTVSSYGDVVPPITLNYTITPFKRTLTVTPGRNEITLGDTTKLTLTTIDAMGNPTGEELVDAQYSIIKGDAYSTLQSLDSTMVGTTIEGVFPSAILRTADDGNAPDSIAILIKTVATVPCPECVLGKIASKDSSTGKRMDRASTRKELLSQRLKRMNPTALTNLQPAIQMKSIKNIPDMTGPQKALDKTMPLSKTTSSSSAHLHKIQYEGVTQGVYGLTKVTVRKSELVVEYPTDNLMERHDIDKTPYMPDIMPRAYLKNYTGGNVNFQWNLRVQWEGPDGRKFDDSFPGNTQSSNSDVSSWVINWKEITRGGGEITLDVTASTGKNYYHKTINHPFKILGDNPTPAQVKEGLTLTQKVLVYQESMPKWCQFGKQKEGYPSWGSPKGYGLMQVDPPSDNEQVWNWKANLAEGKARFDKKFTLAGNYYLDIQNGTTLRDHPYPNDDSGSVDKHYYYDDDGKPIKYNAQPMSADQQLSEAFQRYNGGVYWKWIPDIEKETMGSGKWKAYPPKPKKDHELSYGDECWQLYCNPPTDFN